MLVAAAVMAILVLILATTFTHFTSLTTASGKRLETSAQSRIVFDRMAFDIGGAARAEETPIEFRKNRQATTPDTSLNDSLIFLTDARTTDPQSRFARVAYEIAPETDTATGSTLLSVHRALASFGWSDNIANSAMPHSPLLQPLGRGVFRMELAFLMKTGDLVASLPSGAQTDDIAAIICSTAALDEKSFAALSAAQRNQLIQTLPDAIDGRLPLSDWKPRLFENAGFPASVPRNVRFEQRHFALP